MTNNPAKKFMAQSEPLVHLVEYQRPPFEVPKTSYSFCPMHPVARYSLASVPRLSLRVSRRRATNRQCSQPSNSFHHSPPSRAPEGGDRKPDDASANGSSRKDADVPDEAQHRSHGEDCTSLSVPAVKDLAHYGSAARRSKRGKAQQAVPPSVKLPEWFIDNNTRLLEDTGRSTIGLLRLDRNTSEYVLTDQQVRSGPTNPTGAEPPEKDEKLVRSQVAEESHRSQYFVDDLQWAELVSTTQGLLRLTTQPVANDLASRKNNLIIHYAGDSGAYLVDELLRKLGSELQADVVVLDALDISELACEPHNSSLSNDVADDRRLLSYDVYHIEEGQAHEWRREVEKADESGEQEGENDHDGTPRPTVSAIFLDMKGSPFDLHSGDLSRGQKGQGQGQPGQAGTLMPGSTSFLGGRSKRDVESMIAAQQRLLPLVETLLAGPSIKRTTRRSATKDENSNESSASGPVKHPELPLILGIRDIKILQRTIFGQRFLNLVHQCVENRRRKGQKTIVIGTDTFSKVDTYSPDSIRSLQSEPVGNLSRTLVITPVAPSKDARQLLRWDKKRRTNVINMRHVWQMLCIKVPGLYEDYRLRHEWMSAVEDFPNAISYYLQVAEANRHLWSFDQVHRLATMIVGYMDLHGDATIQEYLKRALSSFMSSDKAKFTWADQQKANRTKSKSDIERVETERLDKLQKKLTRYEKKLVGGIIEPHKIATTFDQVYAPLDTIDTLKTLITLSLVRPDAFKYGILANDRIPGLLLYGPPGTGKTLLAKAVAKESGATVLEVSGAELNDKYVGEGEKNVKALFSLAKKLTPCVVFIDEADALFSRRDGAQRRVSHRELLNQFLREWDGMNNDAGSAFIMVATNRPFDLDDAVLRRLPRRLLIDLPSESDRVEILQIHLRDETMASDVNLADLANKTPFYSGSDLKNLAVAAALNCVREENENAKNHTGESAFEHASRRTLTADHFSKALEDISASISEDMSSLKAIKKFDERFGDRQGRKKKSSRWGFNINPEGEKQLDTVKVRG